jgi:hypothetical protein
MRSYEETTGKQTKVYKETVTSAAGLLALSALPGKTAIAHDPVTTREKKKWRTEHHGYAFRLSELITITFTAKSAQRFAAADSLSPSTRKSPI